MSAAERLAALEAGIEALDCGLTEAGQFAARDAGRIDRLEARLAALFRVIASITDEADMPAQAAEFRHLGGLPEPGSTGQRHLSLVRSQ